MVSPVGSSDAVRALASLIQRSIGQRGKSRSERRKSEGKAASRRTDAILHDVVERVRAIDSTHPDRGRIAIRLFVEGILVAELGQRLSLEPGFHAVVREVEETLYATPALEADLEQVVNTLLG